MVQIYSRLVSHALTTIKVSANTFTQFRFNVGTPSTTLTQPWTSLGWTSRVCEVHRPNCAHKNTPHPWLNHDKETTSSQSNKIVPCIISISKFIIVMLAYPHLLFFLSSQIGQVLLKLVSLMMNVDSKLLAEAQEDAQACTTWVYLPISQMFAQRWTNTCPCFFSKFNRFRWGFSYNINPSYTDFFSFRPLFFIHLKLELIT